MVPRSTQRFQKRPVKRLKKFDKKPSLRESPPQRPCPPTLRQGVKSKKRAASLPGFQVSLARSSLWPPPVNPAQQVVVLEPAGIRAVVAKIVEIDLLQMAPKSPVQTVAIATPTTVVTDVVSPDVAKGRRGAMVEAQQTIRVVHVRRRSPVQPESRKKPLSHARGVSLVEGNLAKHARRASRKKLETI